MPLTKTVPKPMVPIVNVPVMEYCVNLLKKHGFIILLPIPIIYPVKLLIIFRTDGSLG